VRLRSSGACGVAPSEAQSALLLTLTLLSLPPRRAAELVSTLPERTTHRIMARTRARAVCRRCACGSFARTPAAEP
jgi:hypothetical protein